MTPEALRLLVLFASQAGVAVERARLAEETARAMTLAEVDRLRSALMASVSHDLRTPLASIKTSVADLADPEVTFTPEARQMLLATIEAETDRLTHFVANLLDMTRIESGALRLNRSATPIDELVAGVVARFAPVLTGPVTVTLPDDLPLVDADYVLVDQVVANLLENVARHCPPGTSVTLSASSGRTGWRSACRTTDRGWPSPTAPRPSSRCAAAAPGPRRGTGMGLAICEGIVAAHGGTLRVEPGGSAGTTFVLRPAAPARPPPAAGRVPAPHAGRSEALPGHPRVLIPGWSSTMPSTKRWKAMCSDRSSWRSPARATTTVSASAAWTTATGSHPSASSARSCSSTGSSPQPAIGADGSPDRRG